MSSIQKIIIINSAIGVISLFAIPALAATCTYPENTNSSCNGENHCTYAGPVYKGVKGVCVDKDINYRTANKPVDENPCFLGQTLINGQCSDCGETLTLPPRPTQPPTTKPTNGFIDPRIACALGELSKKDAYDELKRVYEKCMAWRGRWGIRGSVPGCVNYILSQNNEIENKCNHLQANILNALWNFVTHRK